MVRRVGNFRKSLARDSSDGLTARFCISLIASDYAEHRFRGAGRTWPGSLLIRSFPGGAAVDGAALLLRGKPGAGKTALLDAVAEAASAAGHHGCAQLHRRRHHPARRHRAALAARPEAKARLMNPPEPKEQRHAEDIGLSHQERRHRDASFLSSTTRITTSR